MAWRFSPVNLQMGFQTENNCRIQQTQSSDTCLRACWIEIFKTIHCSSPKKVLLKCISVSSGNQLGKCLILMLWGLNIRHIQNNTDSSVILTNNTLHLKTPVMTVLTFSGNLVDTSWDRPLRSDSHPSSSSSSCCLSSWGSGFLCGVEGLCTLALQSSCTSCSLRFSNLWLQSLKPSSSSRTKQQLGFSSSSNLWSGEPLPVSNLTEEVESSYWLEVLFLRNADVIYASGLEDWLNVLSSLN